MKFMLNFNINFNMVFFFFRMGQYNIAKLAVETPKCYVSTNHL